MRDIGISFIKLNLNRNLVRRFRNVVFNHMTSERERARERDLERGTKRERD